MTNYDSIIVHTDQKDLTLALLKDMYDANDIITNPDYQRKYIYDIRRASKLVESILIGIPIPVIYLCEEDDGVYSVIDGQQRITSFVKYLKNEYPLTGLTELSDLNGKYFRELDKGTQRKLNTKTLRAITLNRDSQNLKYEIFSRLNLGAVSLKPQELRNCLYRGSFNNMLKDIAKNNPILPVMFHDKNSRSSYEERILRFFTLRDSFVMKSTYVKAMNQYMARHQHDNPNDIQRAKSLFANTLDTVKQILGDDAFFSVESRKKFNGSVYDSIMIPFSNFDKHDLFSHADKIRKKIKEIKETNEEYQQNVYVGSNSSKRVIGRITMISNALSEITGKSGVNKECRFFSLEVKNQLFHPGYICSYCGNAILDISDCEVDHIIPFSEGGPTEISNAQLLHRFCNHSKKNKLNEE